MCSSYIDVKIWPPLKLEITQGCCTNRKTDGKRRQNKLRVRVAWEGRNVGCCFIFVERGNFPSLFPLISPKRLNNVNKSEISSSDKHHGRVAAVTWQALNKDTFIKTHSINEWSMHMLYYALFYVFFINYLI